MIRLSNLRDKPARRDKNERAIVQALRTAGATVTQLSRTGAPDLLVGYNGQNFLIEVKSKHGKLNEYQELWHNTWQGQAAICHTPEQALAVIGCISKRGHVTKK